MKDHSSLNECLQDLGYICCMFCYQLPFAKQFPSPLDLELDLCVATSSSWLDVMISVGSSFPFSEQVETPHGGGGMFRN